MTKTVKNDEAVSPVIGVILMVCVTVILAGTVAAFVFGLVGDIPQNKAVAITMSQTSPGIVTFTNMGGQSSNQLSLLTISGNVTALTGSTLVIPNTVGGMQTVALKCPQVGTNNVVVVGLFKDNTEQVLLAETL